jgi:hypothetical protein
MELIWLETRTDGKRKGYLRRGRSSVRGPPRGHLGINRIMAGQNHAIRGARTSMILSLRALVALWPTEPKGGSKPYLPDIPHFISLAYDLLAGGVQTHSSP